MTDAILEARSNLRNAFDEEGYAGPYALSNLEHVTTVARDIAGLSQGKVNRHRDLPAVLALFNDPALLDQLKQNSRASFTLWRTNLFGKGLGGATMGGIGWHHDKHFQNSESDVDFDEIGAHLSVLVALQDMTLENGAFELLPGSHRHVAGLARDARPFHRRATEEHFMTLPSDLESRRIQITLRQGEFLLFHSALLHRSLPYQSGNTRISLTGRLVRDDILVPDHIKAKNYLVPLALGNRPLGATFSDL